MDEDDYEGCKRFPFDYLPVLDECCYCVPLRVGCYIVSTFHVLLGVAGIASNFARLYQPGFFSMLIALSGIVMYIALVIVAICYIIGLIKDNPSADLMLIVLMLLILFTIVLDLCWFFTNTLKSCPGNCPQIYFFSFKTLLDVVLYGYSIVVINSCRVNFDLE